jgi:hypothetical protein
MQFEKYGLFYLTTTYLLQRARWSFALHKVRFAFKPINS